MLTLYFYLWLLVVIPKRVTNNMDGEDPVDYTLCGFMYPLQYTTDELQRFAEKVRQNTITKRLTVD